MESTPSKPEPTLPACSMCGTIFSPIYKDQHSIALRAIEAGRDLLQACDQAQLFWKYEEVQLIFEALETGQIFEGAPVDALSAISERIFYYLTDAIPAYEPILRHGSTDDQPLVDPSHEKARRLWEAIRTFRRLRQTAFDYSVATAFCSRQVSSQSQP